MPDSSSSVHSVRRNAWWMSVLENGPQSRYLHYFDIDWSGNRVMLPILG
mgnify:CR=1 FL=1